jgi:hypothetical protein
LQRLSDDGISMPQRMKAAWQGVATPARNAVRRTVPISRFIGFGPAPCAV